jgi:hypothetical protein
MDQETKINQLIELCESNQKLIHGLQEQIDQQNKKIIELTKPRTKSIIQISMTYLMGSDQEVHDLLSDNENKCRLSNDYSRLSNDYMKWYHRKGQFIDRYDEAYPDGPIYDFFDTSSKIIMFNMHYVNRIMRFEFLSVFDHAMEESSEICCTFLSGIDENYLGFMVSPTDQKFIYEYGVCDNFDHLFVFEIHQKNKPDHWIQKLSDVVSKSYCGIGPDCVLTISQNRES